MNKNQTTGLLLILLILLAWTMYNKPSEEELESFRTEQNSITEEQQQESINEATKEIEVPIVTPKNIQQTIEQLPDSLKSLSYAANFGAFYRHGSGKEKLQTLENDVLKVTFSNKGGIIKDVWLKEYSKIRLDENMDDEKLPLHLLEDEKNKFNYQLPIANIPSGFIHTADLYFTTTLTDNKISFRISTDNGAYFEQVYNIKPDSYELDYDLHFVGMDRVLTPNTDKINLHWENYLDKLEKNSVYEKRYATVYYKEKDGSFDYTSCTSADIENIDNSNIEWVSHSNQFFNTSLISKEKSFGHAIFETDMLIDDGEDLKLLKTDIEIPIVDVFSMDMYIGPNEFETLKEYNNDIDQVVPFGSSLFGTINRYVIRPIFNFIGNYIGSKGLVILMMIFLIKMALYPLMYKMLHSQAKMGALKPVLAGLKEKYKDDASKVQMETMKIYREYGVSPFGGCMPMLLQMPIWYAMFRFFPASITFRQESFLWANDLSSYDVFWKLPYEIPMYGAHVSLFTLLWAITTIIYTYYNTKHMDMSANPMMKYIQYFMPVTFLVFFNQYASGLTVYMFMSNLINIAQTVLTKKFIFDDEKILAELNAKKALPKKKKGKLAAKFEEALKKSQEIKAQQDAEKGTKKKGKK